MKGNPDVLALLADLLANELTAINQYVLHAETCANLGFNRIADKLREEARGEREHADMLIDRILFLEGVPDLQRYHAIRAGKTVKEMLEGDLAMEYEAIAALETAIGTCRARGDNASEDLLTKILVEEQHDTHWIEAQLGQIRTLGEQNYLAQQLYG
jgi:bacterioferritin